MPEDMIINIEGMNVSVTGLKKLKIGIGMPIGKNVGPEFLTMIFARFGEWIKKCVITIIVDTLTPIDYSRNNIVESAKQNDCDYLFFIDSDTLIEEGHLERLLSHDKDAITGIYYQKVPPYQPLPRKRVTETLYIPLELEGDNIVEIDGSGMGCFLIKMSIFDKIPYPWFEFKYHIKDGKWGQLSEDLYFCQKLQSIGTKIYCDPMVQCTHVGVSLDTQLAQKYKDFRIAATKKRDDTVIELCEYVGMSSEDVFNRWRIATDLVAKEYREFIQNMQKHNHKSPKDFYKENKNYIFDLTSWHMTQRAGFDTDLIKDIKEKYPFAKKILDFGSGCGQNALDLAEAGYEVSMADYEGHTSQFARFRANKRGLNIKFYDIEKPINDKFDIILTFDILEHVPDEDFHKTTELLKSLKRDGGDILITASFGTQGGLHPMHYEESQEKIELIKELKSK